MAEALNPSTGSFVLSSYFFRVQLSPNPGNEKLFRASKVGGSDVGYRKRCPVEGPSSTTGSADICSRDGLPKEAAWPVGTVLNCEAKVCFWSMEGR